jgi:environmental stress-induced protein Ves
MPRLALVTMGEQRRMPWRNGGGTTAEVLSEQGPDGGLLWRLSIAEVAASGPFSDFAGYERHILLLAGDGFVLRFAGGPACRLDRPLEPFTFDGGRPVDCELLGGPVRDLNLMVARGAAEGSLRVLRIPAGRRVELPLTGTVLLYLVEGNLQGGGVPLTPGDTLHAEGPGGEVLDVSAARGSVAVLATITPAGR